MIRVENLTKRYGDHAVVDDVSFTVPGGDTVALWGPNGAGKTTIVRCILGLVAFDGAVEVGGLDTVRHGKAVRRNIGHVPQELAFYDELTVAETMEFSAQLRGIDVMRGGEALEMVGLADEFTKQVGALSGGMKQRLGIALALVHDPPVLLLDEPTSNLDVAARESIVELLESLRDPRRCLLLTSHHLEEVAMLVDRVLAMEDGRVTLECEPAALGERLGLRSWLHVVVPDPEVDRAVAILQDRGLEARRNSRGLVVEVSAQRKGTALTVLQEAGLEILDLEVWR